MTLESIALVAGPMVAITGLIAFYYGVSRIKPLIFPKFRWEIPIFETQTTIDFPQAGNYEFFISRKPKFRLFRRAIETCEANFLVRNTKTGEIIPYNNYGFSFWSRTDLRGNRSVPKGSVEIPSAGSYQVEILGNVYYKDENYISVMSYEGGGFKMFIIIWTLLLGIFLSVGGFVFTAIAWTKGF